MEARLTEEGIWELPPLEEILARGEHIWIRNNLPLARREKRRQKASAEYEIYQTVIGLQKQGVSCREIGRNVGKDYTMIRSWLREHKLPNLLSELVYKKKARREIAISGMPSYDVLRVVGLCLGTTRYHGVYKQRWTYEKNNPKDPAIEYARTVLTAAFGKESFHEHIKKAKNKMNVFYQIIFQSVTFFEWYNRITENSTRIPLEQMPTLEAKLVFAEALCNIGLNVGYEQRKNHDIMPTSLMMTKKTTPEDNSILEQVAVLLNDMGCYSFVGVYGKTGLLRITDPDDITLLLGYGCVSASRQADAEIIAAGATGRNTRGQHMILQAYDEIRLLPKNRTQWLNAEKKEIASRYEIKMDLVGQWYRGESKPHIVQRRDRIRRLREKYGCEPEPKQPHLHTVDGEVLSFMQAASENEHLCRYVAQKYGGEDARFYAFVFERARIEKKDWPRWLMLPEEVLHTRLDRAAPVMVTSNGTMYQISWQAIRDYCGHERFQPYGAQSEEWREHLRTIRDCLPKQPQRGQTTYQSDGLMFTLERADDKVMVTGIR